MCFPPPALYIFLIVSLRFFLSSFFFFLCVAAASLSFGNALVVLHVFSRNSITNIVNPIRPVCHAMDARAFPILLAAAAALLYTHLDTTMNICGRLHRTGWYTYVYYHVHVY